MTGLEQYLDKQSDKISIVGTVEQTASGDDGLSFIGNV